MKNWRISEALLSFRKLNEHLQGMSEAELLSAIEIEQGSRRRKTILERLQMRLSALRAEQSRKSIKESIHGS